MSNFARWLLSPHMRHHAPRLNGRRTDNRRNTRSSSSHTCILLRHTASKCARARPDFRYRMYQCTCPPRSRTHPTHAGARTHKCKVRFQQPRHTHDLVDAFCVVLTTDNRERQRLQECGRYTHQRASDVVQMVTNAFVQPNHVCVVPRRNAIIPVGTHADPRRPSKLGTRNRVTARLQSISKTRHRVKSAAGGDQGSSVVNCSKVKAGKGHARTPIKRSLLRVLPTNRAHCSGGACSRPDPLHKHETRAESMRQIQNACGRTRYGREGWARTVLIQDVAW